MDSFVLVDPKSRNLYSSIQFEDFISLVSIGVRSLLEEKTTLAPQIFCVYYFSSVFLIRNRLNLVDKALLSNTLLWV